MENAPKIYDEKDLVVYRDPSIVLEEARKAAKALSDVIAGKKKKVIFNGEQYLEYEDWQTIGRFYGLSVKVESTHPFQVGDVRGFEARAVVINLKTGQEISAADAMCLNDEDNWGKRTKYEWHYVKKSGGTSKEDPGKLEIIWISGKPKKQRIAVGEEQVPLFQLRSMAQTRACAKALRNVVAWVVVLAGYKPTPVEELQSQPDDVVDIEEVQPEKTKGETTSPEQAPPQTNFLDEMKKYRVKVGRDKFEEIMTGRYGAMKLEDIKPEDQPVILEEMEKAHTERMTKK